MSKDDALNVRINKDDKEAFLSKCKSLNRPYYDMIREMITAFNEGRLKIQVTEEQAKSNKELYDVN